ncbi:MAG: NADH-quinone oxidoreductase subunit G, partial [Mycobacteriaceae bacterium]|nr:NADH-quinone oxidoreductase subunit G [Mycobacteriaceae bacterium]
AFADMRVLNMIADEMGVDLGLGQATAARDELARLGIWTGTRPEPPSVAPGALPRPGEGQAILASWRMLLDAGRLQDGEPYLAGTARRPVARLSAATAAEIGAAEGDPVRVSTEAGSVTLPLAISDMADRVVWMPMNSVTSAVHQKLRVTAGAVVSIEVAR